jgi:hypothetical protein
VERVVVRKTREKRTNLASYGGGRSINILDDGPIGGAGTNVDCDEVNPRFVTYCDGLATIDESNGIPGNHLKTNRRDVGRTEDSTGVSPFCPWPIWTVRMESSHFGYSTFV